MAQQPPAGAALGHGAIKLTLAPVLADASPAGPASAPDQSGTMR
jgi:hypothetical protein